MLWFTFFERVIGITISALILWYSMDRKVSPFWQEVALGGYLGGAAAIWMWWFWTYGDREHAKTVDHQNAVDHAIIRAIRLYRNESAWNPAELMESFHQLRDTIKNHTPVPDLPPPAPLTLTALHKNSADLIQRLTADLDARTKELAAEKARTNFYKGAVFGAAEAAVDEVTQQLGERFHALPVICQRIRARLKTDDLLPDQENSSGPVQS